MRDSVKMILSGAVLMMASGTNAVAQSSVSKGVGINASRLVFNEGDRVISTSVNNDSPVNAYLMAVKVMRNLDGSGDVPFIVTPPLFRLEPESSSGVKIAGNPAQLAQLPRDRETVFYFQATGIPSSNPLERTGSQGFVSGEMKFSLANTIKLFYRPAGLPLSAEMAIKGLAFTRVPGGVRIKNASPYYVNLLSLKIGGKRVPLGENRSVTPTGMLPPFSDATYNTRLLGNAQWSALNDIGGVVDATGDVK
ncbi:fimbrial biogenesis chaperone [Enterobacter asburiae]|uniref:fimbrial biogenesis chaperone n=1 Tax=Enterobacter asburiae TaxID=61645 RepID=UPI0021CED617|nr:molecular chaperone [Enterobacter asburiae]MCU6244082.1 molecular chaperone [Enterobacter asburiae]